MRLVYWSKNLVRVGFPVALSFSVGCGVLNVNPLSLGNQSGQGSLDNSGSNIGANDSGNVQSDGNNDNGDNGYIDMRTAANLTVQPPSYDFQVQSLGSLNYATFMITNTGQKAATNIAATGLSGAYTFRDGSYPGLHGNCGQVLDAGASCRMVITFQPQALTRYQLNSFLVSYDADSPNQKVSIPLDGTATDIATLRFWNITDDNDFFDFGTLMNGTKVTKTIRIRYWGARPATGVAFTGLKDPFSIVSNTCSDTVTADCDLVVQYTADSSETQKLKVTYNNSSYAAEDNESFTGQATAVATPAILTIAGQGGNDYGRELVGSSTDRVFVVTKGGTLPATGISANAFSSGAFSFKGGQYPGTGGTCPLDQILAACTLVATFSPSAMQSYSDTLSINFNDGQTSRTASATILGQGALAAVLSLSPGDPVSFGSHPVNWPSVVQFTLTNAANSVSASAIRVTTDNSAFTYLSGCENPLAPGQSCQFRVRFVPSSAISFTGTLTLSYYDGSQVRNDLRRTLQGNGTAGALITASMPIFNFGNVFVGDTKSAIITINYYGSQAATIKQITGINSPFAFSGGSFPGTQGSCSDVNQKNCTMALTFSPQAAQSYQTTLDIQYDDGTGQTQNFVLFVKGTGVLRAPALLQIAEAPLYDFGSVALGQTKTALLTVVKQSGDYAATQISISGLSGDFRFVGGSYPGTGGSCATSLATGSCSLAVSFASGGNGLEGPITLTLSYFDGVQKESTSLQLQGTGTDLAVLSAGSQKFPNIAVGQKEDLAVTITNQGTRSASSLSIPASVAAPFSLSANSCPSTLASNSSCSLTFHFAPTQPGTVTQTVPISYQNGTASASLVLKLTASGTLPILVSANGNFTCARIPTAQLECWGQNNYGQLGAGDSQTRLSPQASIAVDLGAGRYPVQIATGFFHACALLDDNSLKCWGLNLYGELGLGTTSQIVGNAPGQMGDNLPAVNVGSNATVKQIALGYAHSCVLLSDGGVKCWGDNSEGQLGYGDTSRRGLAAADMGNNLPEVDLGGHRAVQIAANTSHTCALLDDGGIKCWGNNFFGQLGLDDFSNRGDQAGTMGNSLAEVNIGTARTARAVAAGGAFTCAILDDGSVKCWGRNEHGIQGRTWGQDSDGNTGLSSTAFPIALRGYGINPDEMGDSLPAIDLGTGRGALSLKAADSSVCATLDNGSMKCWGQNNYGQLGQGDANDRGLDNTTMGNNLPALSFGTGLSLSDFVLGAFHGCVLTSDDKVKCWGYNKYGQLGSGNTNNLGDAAGEMGDALPFLSF